MGRESIEEGKLSNPLLVKNIDSESQVYGYGGRGENSGAGNEQQSGIFSSSATTMVVLSTLVAVSGSYVFGSAVSFSFVSDLMICALCLDPVSTLEICCSGMGSNGRWCVFEIFLAV